MLIGGLDAYGPNLHSGAQSYDRPKVYAMGEAILVTSGKGGSGKSTFSANVGVALARMGKRVLLIDTDTGLRALDLMLSVADRVVYDLSDVLLGRCETIKAIVETDIENLSLLPAPTLEGEFSGSGIEKLCRGLAQYYDYVLIDSPAGVGSGMEAAAAGADRAVVVSTADPVSIRDADQVARVLLRRGITDIRLVINRIVPKLVRKKAPGGLDRAIDMAALRLLGIVPEDAKVTASVYTGKPAALLKKSAAATAFGNIARRITGEDVPLMKL